MAFILSWQAPAAKPGRVLPPPQNAVYNDEADANTAKVLRQEQGLIACVIVAPPTKPKAFVKLRRGR